MTDQGHKFALLDWNIPVQEEGEEEVDEEELLDYDSEAETSEEE